MINKPSIESVTKELKRLISSDKDKWISSFEKVDINFYEYRKHIMNPLVKEKNGYEVIGYYDGGKAYDYKDNLIGSYSKGVAKKDDSIIGYNGGNMVSIIVRTVEKYIESHDDLISLFNKNRFVLFPDVIGDIIIWSFNKDNTFQAFIVETILLKELIDGDKIKINSDALNIVNGKLFEHRIFLAKNVKTAVDKYNSNHESKIDIRVNSFFGQETNVYGVGGSLIATVEDMVSQLNIVASMLFLIPALLKAKKQTSDKPILSDMITNPENINDIFKNYMI